MVEAGLRFATVATVAPNEWPCPPSIPELCPRHNRRPPTDDQWLVRPLFSEDANGRSVSRRPSALSITGRSASARPDVSAIYPQTVQAPPKASARAAAQLPYRSMTVDGAGHSPACSRLSASPPRRRACVLDQSYEDGGAPQRARHVRIASRTRSRVHSGAIAPGWQRLQYA
jgi:hypothetical protein